MESRVLLAADVSGESAVERTDLESLDITNSAVMTAFLPQGVSRAEFANGLAQHSIGDGDNDTNPYHVHVDRPSVTALITGPESEPNDTFGTADDVPLGFDALEDNAVDIIGTLGSGLIGQDIDGAGWNLGANPDVIDSTLVPHVSISGSGDGTFDYYSFTADAGARGIFDIDSANFDTELFLYNSSGSLVAQNDDAFDPIDGFTLESLIDVVLPATDTYFIGVGRFSSFDAGGEIGGSAPGFGDLYTLQVSVTGHPLNVSGADPVAEIEPNQGGASDVDLFAVELDAGDILGANVSGGANHITFFAPDGSELIGSGQDITFAHPASSPLPGGGNAALSYVIDTAGTYLIAVDGGSGDYELNLRTFRSELESQQRENQQILFLDFDGETVNAVELFGFGNTNAELSPLSNFLGGWGLTLSDEDAVIDAIVASVEESFADIGLIGNNGDFDSDGIDGHYGVTILNSRDHADPFGAENVSRLVVGGSIAELGIGTIGIAESIDVGNFETEETGVILLDLLSAPASNGNSLNQFPIASGFDIVDVVGVGVGNITAHEAGHFLANWHTNQFNSVANIMDQGGNLPGLVGVGPDFIFGTADDVDVDFGKDSYVPNEGFTGVEDTLNAIAFGLSTGTVDTGQRITASSPANGQTLFVSTPTEFVLDLLDPVDESTLDASDLTVNGIPASSVSVDSTGEILTFLFASDPVVEGPGNQMEVAENAFNRLLDGDGVEAYSAVFGYDAIVIEPVSLDPTDGSVVEQPFSSLFVEFNEPYGASSIGIEDLDLSIGTVNGFNFVNETTVEYLLDLPIVEGDLSVTMPDGAVADAAGNTGRGFSASYTLDFGVVPIPVPLNSIDPLGSLIYETGAFGEIASQLSDADGFESGSLGGQWSTNSTILPLVNNLTVADNLISGALPSVAVQGTIDQADLTDAFDGWDGNWGYNNLFPGVGGDDFAVQTTGTLRVNSAGTYSFAMSGDDGGRLRIGGVDVIVDNSVHAFLDTYGEIFLNPGEYSLEWTSFERFLGSGFELSVAVGGGNESEVTTDNGWQVIGDPAPFAEIELVGSLDTTVYYATGVPEPNGRIQVTGQYGTASGDYALLMDRAVSGTSVINEAVWTVDLSGQTEAELSFAHASFGDERNAFPVPFKPFVGQFRGDGISISNDGETWFPAFRAPVQDFGIWVDYSVDLATAVDEAGMTLDDSEFFIKFQQFDNFPLTSDGRGWDDIELTVPTDDSDSFTIDVDPGQTISVIVDGNATLQAGVELFLVEEAPGNGNGNSNGNQGERLRLLDSAVASQKDGSAIIQTIATADNPSVNFEGPRTYQVRVSGFNNTAGTYETTVIVNALIEEEGVVAGSNGEVDTAEDLESSFIGLNQGPFGYATGNAQFNKAGRGAVLGTLGDQSVTVPGELENVEPFFGNAFPFALEAFGREDMRYQQIYSAEEFSDVGVIDELRFRRNYNSAPFSDLLLDAEIRIGYSANSVATASSLFDENLGDEVITVFDGVVNLDSTSPTPPLDQPPPFDFVIDIDDTFNYDPSRGDLIVEFQVRGSSYPFRTFFSAAPSGRLDSTTRIVANGVDATEGILGLTAVNPRPYGLVTQFGFVEEDVYTLDLKKNGTANFSVNALNNGQLNIEILDDAGNVLARGQDSSNLIVNGSFETGDFTGWTTSVAGDPFRPWAVTEAGFGGGFGLEATVPQAGDFVAWNGFDGRSASTEFVMFQDLTIPSDAAAADLSWQDRVQWNFTFGGEATEPRLAIVEVRDVATNALLETLSTFSTGTQAENPTGDTEWVQHHADLSAYIGQTVRLQFRETITQAGTGPGQIEFDDISLVAGDIPSNVDNIIRNFVAPATGTYHVRVSGDLGTDYSMVATRNADFSFEDNNDFESAQPILSSSYAGNQWVLGHTGIGEGVESTITFDELPPQAVDGLAIAGVEFSYTINGTSSPSATFGSNGPGTTTHTSDPSLVGDSSGVLAMDFDVAVTELQFGIALSNTSAVADAATVSLYDTGGNLIEEVSVDADPGEFLFTSGLFQYDGIVPVDRAEVQFNNTAAAAFVLDNLTIKGSESDSDFYRIEARDRKRLVIETRTPASPSGEFGNNFNPIVRLYDSQGNLVAEDDNGLGDGSNSRLLYRVPRGGAGTYYIEVAASTATESPTRGEYILSVSGNDVSAAAIESIAASSPVGSTSVARSASASLARTEASELESAMSEVALSSSAVWATSNNESLRVLMDEFSQDDDDEDEDFLALLAEDQALLG